MLGLPAHATNTITIAATYDSEDTLTPGLKMSPTIKSIQQLPQPLSISSTLGKYATI